MQEVIEMTEPVTCHKGRCRKSNQDHIDECIDCDIVEQIEHDLLRESLEDQKRR